MNKTLYLLAFFLLTVPFSNAAQAELADWYVAPAVAYFDDDGDRALDDSIAGGQINVGRELTERFSVEANLGFSAIGGWFEGQDQIDLGLNLISQLNPEGSFSPYILLGAGYLGTETASGSDENRASGSVGAGFMWDIGDSAWSIRAEYRARLAYEEDNNLTDRITTLGVQFAFGSEPAPISDNDRDGVSDYADQCFDTAPGVVVDSVGCELDSDDDGVVDGKDICAGTPIGTRVDSVGCDTDGDHDGVPNADDACPDTIIGTPVDVYGCSNDTDVDGVLNQNDQCPNTRAGTEVDTIGCDLSGDGDGDGVVNSLDNCPNSRAGVRVDVNGCEITDIIELRGVTFAPNSDRLLAGAEQVLADAIETLKQNPDLMVEVAGHTDSDGNDQLNLGLSERRANTVRDYLINGGVSPVNLTARGFGESEPVSDNNTAEGKAENRRVELRIRRR